MTPSGELVVLKLYMLLLEELGGPGMETLRLHCNGTRVITWAEAKGMVQQEITRMQTLAYQLYVVGRKHEAMSLVDKFQRAMKRTHEHIDSVIEGLPAN